ncbi:MAG TPA: hypothetical protein VNY82_00150, partial [Steroidobacteraceae bacterium]|nr:hypothetical protein [Steroidobacteraceae bacterium]
MLEQHLDPKPVVHLLSTPTCGRRVLIDVYPLPVVGRRQYLPVRQWLRVLGSNTVERPAVGPEEAHCAIIEALNYNSPLMHLTVVEAAQLDKVGEPGFSSVSPVLDVMRVDVPRVRATRESAAAIACVERAANGRRNAARLAPDVERFTLLVLHDSDNAGITRQTTHGLHREGWTVL